MAKRRIKTRKEKSLSLNHETGSYLKLEGVCETKKREREREIDR